MTEPPKKRRPMGEGDAAAGMAKFVAGLPQLRDRVAETREQLAYLIRAELVCCDIYDKLNAGLYEDECERCVCDKTHAMRRRAAKADGSWHDICYFGEWAARLCLTGDLPAFPLIYTDRLNDDEWVEELVQPGPVRIKTVFPNAERPKRLKKMLDG